MIDRRTLLSASTSGVVLGALPGLGGAMARAAEAPPARQGVAMSDGAPLSPDMPVPLAACSIPCPLPIPACAGWTMAGASLKATLPWRRRAATTIPTT
jgi:hypothetical protein